MLRNRNHRAPALLAVGWAIVMLAMLVVAISAPRGRAPTADAWAALAPPPEPLPCVNCAAEQTLPSADDIPATNPAVPPNDPAVQAQLPGCAVWTDSCVTCRREAGKISCSNIGIACQPKAVECVRNEPVEERKQEN